MNATMVASGTDLQPLSGGDVLSPAGCSRGRAQHRLAYLAAFFGPIALIYILLHR